MYANNPKYKLEKEIGRYKLYTPLNVTDYHKSREVEANVQNTWANSGVTPEYLDQLCEEGLKMFENDPKNENLRANGIAILNQIRYRIKYKIDGLCAIRMGAILTMIEWEEEGNAISEPEVITYPWIKKKIDLAHDPKLWELYDFFFQLGLISTEAYLNRLEDLKKADYFDQRNEIIQSFTPLAIGYKKFTVTYPYHASKEAKATK